MMPLLTLLACWLAAMIASELVLKGTKLQTGLMKVLAVYFVIGTGSLFYMMNSGKLGMVSGFVFWSGCFLSWFGIRSHLESSILLRMLFLLRKRSWTPSELVSEYEAHYGEAARIEELVRGGLTAEGSNPPLLTSKGQMIVRIVTFLNHASGN